MPAKRVFTQDEIDLARSMSDTCESWRSIGRALRCNEDTIRRHFEPDYGAARCAAIVATRRTRRRSEAA